jgi:hypothetical protein
MKTTVQWSTDGVQHFRFAKTLSVLRLPPCRNKTASKERLSIKRLINSAGREKRTVWDDDNGQVARQEYLGKDLACRLQGLAEVNKVTGMFHVTAIGRGYAGERTPAECKSILFILLFIVAVLNFSHRIDKFSFGNYFPGLKNPLDAGLEETIVRKVLPLLRSN